LKRPALGEDAGSGGSGDAAGAVVDVAWHPTRALCAAVSGRRMFLVDGVTGAVLLAAGPCTRVRGTCLPVHLKVSQPHTAQVAWYVKLNRERVARQRRRMRRVCAGALFNYERAVIGERSAKPCHAAPLPLPALALAYSPAALGARLVVLLCDGRDKQISPDTPVGPPLLELYGAL
jgi:hypothetical protein